MAGHTATKALSHSYEAYLITVLQRAIRLCLSFANICVSPTLSHSLTQSQTAHSQSALYNRWCCHTNYTAAQCSGQMCSIIPLNGLF